MRIILLAFVGFLLSAIFLLPYVNEQLVLPEDYYLYGPLALMLIAILIQIDGAFAFKKVLKARQVSVENASLEAELKDVTGKLHQEKKAITELKSQLSQQEREIRQLHATRDKLRAEVATSQEEKSKLKTAIGDALQRHKDIEGKLQDIAKQMQSGERDVLHLLSLLQEKGRFIDFLMDDITKYQDAQIGAAARVVHQGCSKVIGDYFEISPVSEEREGSKINIAENYHPKEYRFLGKVGEPPFQGTVLHRGWCTKKVKLPQVVEKEEEKHLPSGAQVITPAEVELS